LFFSITSTQQTNFSHFYQLGPFVVSTDAGWQQVNTDRYSCIYKGYTDRLRLTDLLEQIVKQNEPEQSGNFCVIVYDNQQRHLQVKSDRWRGFPLYFEDGIVTNLVPRANTAWSDSLLTVQDDWTIVEDKFDVIGELDDTPVTLDALVVFVDQRLTEKTQNLVKYHTAPIRAFVSGGVDTTLVYSYLQKYTQDFELVKYNILEYDRFWLQNSGDITDRHWGYKQIHHWTSPSVLTSGAPGDEFMLRSPGYADQYLKYYGVEIVDLLEQRQWLHTSYFSQAKHLKLFKEQSVDRTMTKQQLQWNLCNNAVNDWQHWHIGHTLTWTPLRDLDIYKMFLRLSPADAVVQVLDSSISRRLIEQNCPGLSQTMSDQKNTGNCLENLADYLLGPASSVA